MASFDRTSAAVLLLSLGAACWAHDLPEQAPVEWRDNPETLLEFALRDADLPFVQELRGEPPPETGSPLPFLVTLEERALGTFPTPPESFSALKREEAEAAASLARIRSEMETLIRQHPGSETADKVERFLERLDREEKPLPKTESSPFRSVVTYTR